MEDLLGVWCSVKGRVRAFGWKSRKGSNSETKGFFELLESRIRKGREREPHESSDPALKKGAEDAWWDLDARHLS